MKFYSFITSLFWEKKCYVCSQPWHFFCPRCLRDIPVNTPYCYASKKYSDAFYTYPQYKKDFPFQQAVVLGRYRDVTLKKLLQHGKYYHKPFLYKELIEVHSDFFRRYIYSQEKNIVFIPVPLFFLKKWKRWYNQSEIIAQTLADICGGVVLHDMIYKRSMTKSQSHLTAKERKKNVLWTFALRNTKKIDQNSTIYIIDDILSTASTVKEICVLLQGVWYQDIRVVAIASD